MGIHGSGSNGGCDETAEIGGPRPAIRFGFLGAKNGLMLCLMLFMVLAQPVRARAQEPVAGSPNKSQTRTGTSKGKTTSHCAVTEEGEWSRTLLLNSEAAYTDFYEKFPDTRRLAVLHGTLTAEIGGVWKGNGFVNEVTLMMNDSSVYRMSMEEASQWELVVRERTPGGYC
jgi:hypothetical protein